MRALLHSNTFASAVMAACFAAGLLYFGWELVR